MNPEDLSIVPVNGQTPTRSAKLADTVLQAIGKTNSIRWVIAAQYSMFYRLGSTPFTSDNAGFALPNSCGLNESPANVYTAFATPNNAPVWITTGSRLNVCGGGMDSTGAWLILASIVNGGGVPCCLGAYTGSSSFRGVAPSKYTATTAANDNWNVPGYIFLSW